MKWDLLIAGCSRRKAPERRPLPALERYTGGIAPHLRTRFAGHRTARDRIRFLSAEHGLVHADTLLTPYDRQLTPAHADRLRPLVAEQLTREFKAEGVPDRVLLVLEPLYLVPLADLLEHPGRPTLHWVHDPRGWAETAAVLDEWRWP
ncbi:hypothetical protein P3T35_006178 [Kitasatospora sp. GP30]|uniref:DUF6884 domain-containing protein n=1 Tax=Kitasatospora sp. GP30 TaxID=3035084 RepID=UPI000C712AAB|nr:DUF6884 domain-containing protein [Kitasatospora sp. GP30]MDH6144141.1 hypothetical protein [Kitasatospora sp. GP30]